MAITPKQQIRMPDELWERFKDHAQAQGYSGAEAVRAFCREYVTGALDSAPWLSSLVPAAADADVDGVSAGGGGQSGHFPSAASA